MDVFVDFFFIFGVISIGEFGEFEFFYFVVDVVGRVVDVDSSFFFIFGKYLYL